MKFHISLPPVAELRPYIPERLPYSHRHGYIRHAFGPSLRIERKDWEYQLNGNGVILYFLPRYRRWIVYYSDVDYLPVAVMYLWRYRRAYLPELTFLLQKYDELKGGYKNELS